jgi:diaminohydroxyphosphoribosylaminopyrimidine deaminase/5-amino-6-(5-phosphoribosylamino)uracil reductase
VIIRSRAEDESFMAEALRLAGRIPRRPWPNPPVGAVVVRDGASVGRGAHLGAGTPHAEVLALEQAGRLARGATLYCTLEPCNHVGRTPPCAPQVVESGVSRVVIALADPNPGVAGGGLRLIHDAGIDVSLGTLGGAALELIWPFVSTSAFERPFVLLKTACSLDGCFSARRLPSEEHPTPAYLTGLEARRDVHRLRRWADFVLVGERTVATDRPRLDGRQAGEGHECPEAEPMAAYVDTDLSFAGDWHQERFYVFGGKERASAPARARLVQKGGTVVLCDERDGRVAPEALLGEILARGGWSVLLEGGPTLAATFLERGLVDRWVSYTAPVVVGSGLRWPDWPLDSRPACLRSEPAGERAARLLTHGEPPADPADDIRRFHLTDVSRCGTDVRTVFDRLSFPEVLESLTRRVVEDLQRPSKGA